MATTKKAPTWYIWVMVGIPIGVLIMVLLNKCGGDGNKETVYKTDTVHRDIFIHDTTHVTIEVPPKTVIVYKDIPIEVPPKTVIAYKDIPYNPQVVFEADSSDGYAWDTVSHEVPTQQSIFDLIGKLNAYQRAYPFAPKLIEGHFTGDTLALTILDTTGFYKKIYPVFYNKYGYIWKLDGTLNKYDIPNRLTPNKPKIPLSLKSIWTQGYVDASYSLVHGGLVTSGDYLVGYKNFGIFGHGELRTFPKYTDLRIGVRYIWGSRKN